ncbi:hypothetical protein OE88DRAFT_1043546 [Heliocybe sulcata]|uniref:Uncharacterized protein n=1 Tax=Heliocybe sulcata TaxID=5364 RepID=A0A5C3MLL7_9AGAM|nr:hypothetical protein OE88DRAFT_1043546 [Heliocybe sulcata]
MRTRGMARVNTMRMQRKLSAAYSTYLEVFIFTKAVSALVAVLGDVVQWSSRSRFLSSSITIAMSSFTGRLWSLEQCTLEMRHQNLRMHSQSIVYRLQEKLHATGTMNDLPLCGGLGTSQQE